MIRKPEKISKRHRKNATNNGTTGAAPQPGTSAPPQPGTSSKKRKLQINPAVPAKPLSVKELFGTDSEDEEEECEKKRSQKTGTLPSHLICYFTKKLKK